MGVQTAVKVHTLQVKCSKLLTDRSRRYIAVANILKVTDVNF
jgi:hypothetical protein